MENQTRFNLSAAVDNWRQELAAEPNLTPVVRNELETHLRDTIAEFQRRGLNDDESFWLARRRIGPSQPLGEEFLKANPAAVWRERIMWMALAVLVVFLWSQTAGIISYYVMGFVSSGLRAQIMFSLLLRTVPILVVISFLLRGKDQTFLKLALFFHSRSRFRIAAIGWLALNEGLLSYRWVGRTNYFNGPTASPWINLVSTSFWPLVLIVLIAWLMGPDLESGGAKKGPPRHTFLMALMVILPALVVLGTGCLPVFKHSILIKALLCLQLPYLLALWSWGILNHETLVNLRGSIIIWNLILGALLTTPYVVNQLMMAAALQVLYELSLWIVFRWEQRQNAHLE
jgi:hypothetical protein